MPITDIDPPAQAPITLEMAKSFLRVDGVDEEALILDMITGAWMRVERLICQSLIQRRRHYLGPCPKGRELLIAHSPVRSIEALNLIDFDGQSHAVALSELTICHRRSPVSIRPQSGRNWSEMISPIDHIEVEFTAGYGLDPEDVPMPLRQAVLLLLAQSYEFRDERDPDLTHPIPMMVEALLMPYQRVRL